MRMKCFRVVLLTKAAFVGILCLVAVMVWINRTEKFNVSIQGNEVRDILHLNSAMRAYTKWTPFIKRSVVEKPKFFFHIDCKKYFYSHCQYTACSHSLPKRIKIWVARFCLDGREYNRNMRNGYARVHRRRRVGRVKN